MHKLLLKFNAAVIKEYSLDKPAFSVGRKTDNDIVIDNPTVSAHHCKITFVGDTYFVEDLNSTNGTLLNSRELHGEAELTPGDVIRIGDTEFRFEVS